MKHVLRHVLKKKRPHPCASAVRPGPRTPSFSSLGILQPRRATYLMVEMRSEARWWWWQFTSRNFQLSKSSIELPTASFAPARAPQILIKSLPAPETLGYPTDAAFPLQGTPGRCFYLPWMDHPRPSIHPLRTRWQSDFKPCRSGSFCFRQFFFMGTFAGSAAAGGSAPRSLWMRAPTYPDFQMESRTREREWRVTPHASVGSDLAKVEASSESFHHATARSSPFTRSSSSLSNKPNKKSNTKSATICNSVRLDPLK
jgi:hypothetical protein